jgi:hypothetical protein
MRLDDDYEVMRLLYALETGERRVEDFSDEELRSVLEYQDGSGINLSQLTDEELEAEIVRLSIK